MGARAKVQRLAEQPADREARAPAQSAELEARVREQVQAQAGARILTSTAADRVTIHCVYSTNAAQVEQTLSVWSRKARPCN